MDQTDDFSHVEHWVFDLDNTLYPARCRLFDQIDLKMGAFIADRLGVDRTEARRIQKKFFFEIGALLLCTMECKIRNSRNLRESSFFSSNSFRFLIAHFAVPALLCPAANIHLET